MDLNLKGKNALVCGSSKGIGKAAALEIAALGANVTLLARSATLMVDIIHEMAHQPGQHHDFLVADYKNRADLKKKVRTLAASRPIHILVNNSGGPPAGLITSAKVEEFEQAFHNHVLCNHVLVQTVLGGMKASGFGRIINIISTSVKEPLDNLGVSNTTRAAVANWAKTLANELGPFGITVNNVLPGKTDTERLQEILTHQATSNNQSPEEISKDWKKEIPLGRFAAPKEVAAAVAFLASPAAAYITGINLPVDGGRTRSL